VKIVIAGGSGFIGEPLARRLATRAEVVVLSRDPERVKAGRGVQWTPGAGGAWERDIADAAVVINLAGENIGAGRWTAARKKRLVNSRLDSTGALVRAMQAWPDPSRRFISASAIGYYGARGDEILDESSPPGDDFLARLTREWESVAHRADGAAHVVVLRFGIVLASDGGALPRMVLPVRLFAGGPLGRGDQWMSWIDRDDLVRMIEWTMDRPEPKAVYNGTAPSPLRNRDFIGILARTLGRPAFMPAPAIALRIALGEMAGPLLLASERVVPANAIGDGFTFLYPELAESLQHVFQTVTARS
jgi:uncharacterized protein (TIGR01777 family)